MAQVLAAGINPVDYKLPSIIPFMQVQYHTLHAATPSPLPPRSTTSHPVVLYTHAPVQHEYAARERVRVRMCAHAALGIFRARESASMCAEK